jgi:hypothetical protein
MSQSIDTDTHKRASTHRYEYIHIHPTLINTFERINRFNLKIHEGGQRTSYYRRVLLTTKK